MAPRKRCRTEAGKRVAHANSRPQAAVAANRPKPGELAVAAAIIESMKQVDKEGLQPPLLPPRGGDPKGNIVALALARFFGETFDGDAAAKRLFGVGKGTDIDAWIKEKLQRFFDLDDATRWGWLKLLLRRPTASFATQSAICCGREAIWSRSHHC